MIAENVCRGRKLNPSKAGIVAVARRLAHKVVLRKLHARRSGYQSGSTGPERSPSARPEAIARRARYCVHESGRGAIAGIDVGEAETEAFWRQVLKSLIATSRPQRGSADAHAGRKAAIVRHLHFPW
jgi:hypothetical protein